MYFNLFGKVVDIESAEILKFNPMGCEDLLQTDEDLEKVKSAVINQSVYFSSSPSGKPCNDTELCKTYVLYNKRKSKLERRRIKQRLNKKKRIRKKKKSEKVE